MDNEATFLGLLFFLSMSKIVCSICGNYNLYLKVNGGYYCDYCLGYTETEEQTKELKKHDYASMPNL